MKKVLSEVLKNHNRLKLFLITIYKYKRSYGLPKAFLFGIKMVLFKPHINYKQTESDIIYQLLKKVKVDVDDSIFIYSIDEYKLFYPNTNIYENTTVDYSLILDNSLDDLKKEVLALPNNDYKASQLKVIEAIELYLNRHIDSIKKSNIKDKERKIEIFSRILNNSAGSFEEALQRILFFNSLLWQTGHSLNGLGRLDKILDKYYQKDIKSKIITNESCGNLVSDFLSTLHKYYWLKSSVLLGDTGQIIILGGKDKSGNYFSNELTKMFIDKLKDLQIPDPKLLLRVCNNTPIDLLKNSLDCIKTGIGCPLFANDDVIIPKLIRFGYKDNAYDYITSACWEPLIANKSVEQNNIESFVFMKPFNDMLREVDLKKIKSTKELIKNYKGYLKTYTESFIKEIGDKQYDLDPVMSLFVPSCNIKCKDITNGGSIYNNYGMTGVSLGNVVNSIINIDNFVFKNHEYTFFDFNKIRLNNFNDNDELLTRLKNTSLRYGNDDESVINICNEIIDYVNSILKDKKNRFGGGFKLGLSSPSYIIKSQDMEASFDGRKKGDPFIVHISSDVSGLAYTELINFSSMLHVDGNMFNGNVVDFIVSPNFIEQNYDKFLSFIKKSIEVGFFEMQMNVVSSDTLIKAKNNPKEFPNLIVRVWGFSAYFNDLPESYKDLLIERALKSEGKSY